MVWIARPEPNPNLLAGDWFNRFRPAIKKETLRGSLKRLPRSAF
jgi:hypothetical protein